MKKVLTLLMILVAITLFISACGDDMEPTNNTTPAESEDNTSEEESFSSENDLNIEAEDQLDLRIGDKGTFDTTIGQFEITLDGAKIIKEKLDGEESQLDDLLLLDLTVKNISGETMLLEDILESTIVKDNLEHSGNHDASGYFDSVKGLTGEIADGEIISGQFITDINERDEYYLVQDSGAVSIGTTNQVMWTIPASEAQ
ncbi:hypothetical protein [Oceanobacillus chungangensis]|uniref:DUF4352 domain-containing protein n=1 Tax=Oceanobacillus chungangensis TaxID=1229152 RepID=A0A3D8PZU7_9BACI|nr:hypothetical protein [Oceanobacillus chungangensis]RDW21720.1 hypothetical protein CWR45_02275 [Oceanobacillus chungangensis]